MSNLLIFEMIPKIMQEVGSVGKSGYNTFDKYKFRSIEDVYNALQPVLARNGVFIVPRIINSEETKIQSQAGKDQIRVKVRVEYSVCARDGSSITSAFEGEGIDRSDKATNKAFQASFKYMVSQLFCLSFEGMEDSDRESPDIAPKVDAKPTPIVKSKPEAAKLNQSNNDTLPPRDLPPPIANHAIIPSSIDWKTYKLTFNFGTFKAGTTFEQLGKNDTVNLAKAIRSWKLKQESENKPVPSMFDVFLKVSDQYLEHLN